MPIGRTTWTWNDYDAEPSSFNVNHVQLTAGNIVATTALLGAVKTALDDIVIGHFSHEATYALVTEGDKIPSSNPYAQREAKFLLRFHSTVTGDLITRELPMPDLGVAGLLLPNSKFMDLTAGEGLALKTALDAVMKDKDGNTATLTSAEFKGRNN